MSTEKEGLQFKAGEKVEKFSDNIRTVEVKIVELNDKMISEISNLRAQISAGRITSTRASTVAEVGQSKDSRLSPTTTTHTLVSKNMAPTVSATVVSCPNTTHRFNVNSVQVHINTFTAIVDLSRFNNSCLKSPVSTLVDLTFQSRALRSFSLNQLRNL